MADLLDVNVWLALAAPGHPQHQTALEAWDRLNRPTFCRITQLGLVRLLCNKQVMGKETFEPEEAWTKYQALIESDLVHFMEEPEGIEANLKRMLKGSRATRDFWTDAYLAAFAKSGGMRLVSFDVGFTRFRDLNSLLLKTPTS